MTNEKAASEGEKASDKFAKEYGSFDAEDDKRCFLAGVKWTIEQAQKLVTIPYPDKPTLERVFMYEIKKLLGETNER